VSYSSPPEPQPATADEPIVQPGEPSTHAALYSPDGRWYWDGGQWLPVAAPPPAWARPYAQPESRATAAVTLVGVAIAGMVLLLLEQGSLLAVYLTDFQGSALDQANGLLAAAAFFVYWAGLVGGAIAVPMWMHRCVRNLPALGATRTGWSPAWAVWGWFIPFANLAIPYLVVRELWRQVHLDARPAFPLVGVWWALWVVGQVGLLVTGTVLSATLAGFVVGIAIDLATVAAGVLLIVIIRQVTRRQRARYAQLHAT
jgi:hypothetical protein